MTTSTDDAALTLLRILAPVGAAVMIAAVAVGLMTAPAGAAGELLANVWGRVTTVDLYLALTATWLWIAWRERRPARAALWAVLLVTTGSIALFVYVTIAARAAASVPEVLVGDR